MGAESSRKVPGILLPGDRPLRTEQVAKGLYVVRDDPYTEQYDFFDLTRLHRKAEPDKATAPRRPTTRT